MKSTLPFKTSIIASLLALTGCGGSSSSSDPVVEPPANQAPQVSLTTQEVNEGTMLSITADASDSDGTIASYEWQVTSDHTVELSGGTSDTVSFTAPAVMADEVMTLSLTVTDDDGATASADVSVNINQLTIPLTISGLATDSPISNAQITVHVAGQEITVDATADENGAYTVDLLLDDSQADAFISIQAKGVAEQANAGLISLLGTAGELSNLAGDDNTLTADDDFSVNVTNVTTAQYALAKVANGGEAITTDEQLAQLTQNLKYDDVIALATAIKVAIDKTADNPDLALPDDVSDTLALVENIDVATDYLNDVSTAPEFEEAKQEIFNDANLVDTQSTYDVPEMYYILPPSSFHVGQIARFNADNTGSYSGEELTWSESEGVISAELKSPNSYSAFETREVNGEMVQVRVDRSESGYTFKRLSTGADSDVLLIATVTTISYPDGELPDEVDSNNVVVSAVKSSGVGTISHSGAGVAYLPFAPIVDEMPRMFSDEFVLNADGTGHATVMDFSFNWRVQDGALEIYDESEGYVAKWQNVSSSGVVTQLSHEYQENDMLDIKEDSVAAGAILSARQNWNESSVTGLYQYDVSLDNAYKNYIWYELSEGGNMQRYSTWDANGDGSISDDELNVQYGNWQIDADGFLVLTRVYHHELWITPECRYESQECIVRAREKWRLMGQSNSFVDVFRDFYWASDGYREYGNTGYHKISQPPVSVSTQDVNVPQKSPTKMQQHIEQHLPRVKW